MKEILLVLVLISLCAKSSAADSHRVRLIFSSNFYGQHISVSGPDGLVFEGRLTTDEVTGHAATVILNLEDGEAAEIEWRHEEGVSEFRKVFVAEKGAFLELFFLGNEGQLFKVFQTQRSRSFY